MIDVRVERDVIYAKADGYWTSAPVGVAGTVPSSFPNLSGSVPWT